MFKKRLAQKILRDIHNIDDANTFMDRIVDNLTEHDLKRAYESSKKKHAIKQTKHTLYMQNYFMNKCDERKREDDEKQREELMRK